MHLCTKKLSNMHEKILKYEFSANKNTKICAKKNYYLWFINQKYLSEDSMLKISKRDKAFKNTFLTFDINIRPFILLNFQRIVSASLSVHTQDRCL